MKLSVADRRWVGRRVVVAAPGPSLNSEVSALCNGEHIIAVCDAVRLFPTADVLYACDAVWWEVNKAVLSSFAGERWTTHSISPRNSKQNFDSELFHIIAGRNALGFSTDPTTVHYGNNSGFQAVNLAILFGATEIVLVGFDMRKVNNRTHFFGEHKAPLRATHSFSVWIENFNIAAKMLDSRIRILNATPNSALRCFPVASFEEIKVLEMTE